MTGIPVPLDHTPVIVAARRTAIGVAGRALAAVPVAELAAPVLAALAADLDGLGVPGPVDDVVLGNTRGPGGNLARVAALAAGLGVQVPGMTVDRQCGSGQAAIQAAADAVAAGASLVLAGGAESSSIQPTTIHPGAEAPYLRAAFAPTGFADPEMGSAAQALADRAGVGRARQDGYALRSHELALASIGSGAETDETVVVAGLAADERPRRMNARVLARMPGAFIPGGSVTVGNSCGLSDGAAAVAVVPERTRTELGLTGLAIRAWGQVGVDPALPGIGPVPAVRRVLDRCGLGWADVDVLEIVEAFAGQVLACTDAWGLDPLGVDTDRVCPSGGAIARGHPWGASGAMLAVALFRRLVRQDRGRIGVATCAIGGGQGVALVVERVG